MGQMKVWIEVLRLASRLNLKYLRRFIFLLFLPHTFFVSPGDAPGAITLSVVWMETEFDAYKLSRCTCPYNYNRFWDRARYLWKNRHFIIPLAFDAPVRGVPVGISPPRLVWNKLEWLGYPMLKKIEDICNRLGTIPACDRQTDRRTNEQTSCHGIYALCIGVAQ